MTEGFVFTPSPRPSVAVAGDARRFPVRRIFCVALNYAEHAREMGKEPGAEPPFYFAKPADAVVKDGATIAFPSLTRNLHHEIELVAALHSGGRDIAPQQALDCVFGYAAGIDLTRRDLQTAARNSGKPWDFSKGFDNSAPIGAIRPAAAIGHPASGRIALSVNGGLRQQGDLSDMIWSLPQIIADISRYVALAPGDLIFTGTPSGVAAMQPGDHAEGEIEGVGSVSVSFAA
ncbi:fumarylacetoacetate hydrolase family protein [Methylocystis parvus]|uniref:Fumarylacetoacetate hydrolase family protein n=1 Tax=Methylocystis parvus TaxID=134 RepID=A0A6B8M574_9HYPH|nr:fumarylacetoacetate hydrolase family protein [Methylocystis parvus]QGM96919.1 fumarylacetoacetate hydrolase family protein [Methylocystis parvus]WBJ99195.1 fumarylacetoacetate hydrolase family protein [Methylocystis parvus OBBP]